MRGHIPFFSIFTPLGWVLLWPRFSFLSSCYYRCALPCPTHTVLRSLMFLKPRSAAQNCPQAFSHLPTWSFLCPNFLADCSFRPHSASAGSVTWLLRSLATLPPCPHRRSGSAACCSHWLQLPQRLWGCRCLSSVLTLSLAQSNSCICIWVS